MAEKSSTKAQPIMPTTMEELWGQGWVAENEEEAVAQAERMFDLFYGKAVAIDRLMFVWGEDVDEWMFEKPWPVVWLIDLSVNSGWYGGELLPEWSVRPDDDDQVVTELGTDHTIRLGDITGWITTTAPAIGTAEGFGNKDALVFPQKSEDEDG
jgi:hypothetical protein